VVVTGVSVVVVISESGIVVEVVVVVDDVVVEVVVVEVVAEVTGSGHEAVATVGRTRNGLSLLVVGVVLGFGFDAGALVAVGVFAGIVVGVGTSVSSVIGSIASASESAGATAGGSLCNNDSILSTIIPKLFSRAHDATFCWSGSFG
jgi:hypothetical protein